MDAGAAQEELHSGPVPVPVGAGVHLRQRRLSQDARRRRKTATALLKEQAERRARGELMGIGFRRSPRWRRAVKHFDILGIKMFDSAEIRIHPGLRNRARHQVSGTGARNDMGADRRRGTGARPAEHHGRGRRHRYGATAWAPTRAAARRSWRSVRWPPPNSEGAQDCRAPVGRRRRRRMDRLQVPGEGVPSKTVTMKKSPLP